MSTTSEKMLELISDKLNRYFATSTKNASADQVYKALALVLRDKLLQKKQENNQRIVQGKYKRVYYLCMEFLLGRSLKNNLYNLGLEESAREALGSMGHKLEDIYELESDAGLGNGGLGRLAACFMDSLATLNYPAMGFSIRYEYGLFRQKIVENQQVELPDIWLDSGEVWQMPRSDKNFEIKLGGTVREYWENGKCRVEHTGAEIVEALPYDVMISGEGSDGVSVLRLWRASAKKNFDMTSFTQGNYMMAMRADTEAELISKVLYPSDDHEQGKQLRLSQQYFLVSASLQSIIKDHLKNNKSLNNLPDLVAIHINDTHPALAIPELMRLLIDEFGYDWDSAWSITTRTINYTNHTVMAEALEKWREDLVRMRLPRIYMILKEIDRRFCNDAMQRCNDFDKVNRMAIIGGGQVRMANLAVVGSQKVNGVSELHSEIIKDSVFHDFYTITPEKFTNVTNGIAHRRWLCQSNPGLKDLVCDLVGEGVGTDASKLSGLMKYKNDKQVLERIGKIKHECKVNFANYIKETAGVTINPESRIDTQIKRLHEYKRQLMNTLKIISQYLDLLDDPNKDVTPQTFVFGAKAAGGYYHAKRIISLINCLSAEIQKNPRIKQKLDVLFVENYNVTKAERLIPASEVSEQISLAGKEASGTSNMKFMLNGAVTLGTLDGANVEILEEVGEDNIFIFGMHADEVERMWGNYYPTNLYTGNYEIKRIVDRLRVGFDGTSFADIANYLVLGSNNIADPYMCLLDYGDYVRAARELDEAYKDKERWNRMALVNIAKSGVFASDRSIDEYAHNIWNLRKVKKPRVQK
ncbi:MAG: glycogen/starch/alpha-glucan phosphorylase [Clostridiales bacterium]|nr:glycogen/starch/alpha-glucan phosphorylase [Clostridiales bacterium]